MIRSMEMKKRRKEIEWRRDFLWQKRRLKSSGDAKTIALLIW
jgi:hypothetical protein